MNPLIASVINSLPRRQNVPQVPFESVFNSDLARRGATSQADTYFDPIRQKGLREILQGFTDRGLMRSAQRVSGEKDYNADINDQRAQMIERLFNIRETEATNRYNRQRKLLENGYGV